MAGSIQKRKDRPDKPYRARFWAPDGKQRSKSFAKKTDAEIWLRSELSKLDRGVWHDPKAGTITLSEWSEEWLHGLTATANMKPKTMAGYQSILRSRVLPVFGGYQLRQIQPTAVRKWMADMATEGLSPATIRAHRQLLNAMMAQAVEDDVIPRNPVAKVKPPKVQKRRQLFLTAEQASRLADACEERQEGMGMLIRFLAYSGVRWGEAVALQRSSITLQGRRVRIKEAATEIAGKLEFGTPKTHDARTIILPEFIAARLATHIQEMAKDALVFTAPQGGPLRSSNFRRSVWTPACEASGMPEGLLIHDLRDTAASLAISAGASIKAIQRMLGHKHASMTLDVYGSLFEEDLEDLAERMDAKFSKADAAGSAEEDKVVHLRR